MLILSCIIGNAAVMAYLPPTHVSSMHVCVHGLRFNRYGKYFLAGCCPASHVCPYPGVCMEQSQE
eukprot:11824590-Ditylum_brightwellii.AAC.1